MHDLVIGSGGNEPGMNRANFLLDYISMMATAICAAAPSAIPPVIGNFSTIKAEDIDNDGDDDLFLGARNVPGNYGLPPRSYLFVNDEDPGQICAAGLANIGMVTDAAWADIDTDGDKDLVVVGDWMAITFFTMKTEHSITRK